MSGESAQRGFIFQTFVAIIECLKLKDDEWDKIKLEPGPADSENDKSREAWDKVDIQLYKGEGKYCAIQVKSRKNNIGPSTVEKWAKEIVGTRLHFEKYELIIVGDSKSENWEERKKEIEKSTGIVIKYYPFDYIEEICIGLIAKYMKGLKWDGYNEPILLREPIESFGQLFSVFHFNNIEQEPIGREDFKRRFIHLLVEEQKIAEYYEYIKRTVEKENKNSIYGDISLNQAYIAPSIKVDQERRLLKDYIKEWVEGIGETDPYERIMLVYSNPGQGKTSFGQMAVYDYYKNKWLADVKKIRNVFYFSLNSSVVTNRNTLSSFFSWGERSEKQKIGVESLNEALIILDGVDELVDSKLNRYTIIELVQNVVEFFNINQCEPYIIFTSKKMYIQRELNETNGLKNLRTVKAYKIEPISGDDQIGWLEKYIKYLARKNPEKCKRLKDYRHNFEEMQASIHSDKADDEEKALEKMMEIPALFRMIVEAEYTHKNTGVTGLYENLFDTTSKNLLDLGSYKRIDDIKQGYQQLAVSIFKNDTNAAIMTEKDDKGLPWTYNHYVPGNKINVSFYVKPFYCYFLALVIHDILLSEEENNIHELLMELSLRRLDGITLNYLEELSVGKNLSKSSDTIYGYLNSTEGIQHIGGTNTVPTEQLSSFERANNIFWNGLSICASVGSALKDSKHRNILKRIRNFDLRDCRLQRIELPRSNVSLVDFSGTRLCNGVFDESDCHSSKFVSAILNNASFRSSDLSDTNFSYAKGVGADFSHSKLRFATFRRAELYSTNMSFVDLRDAVLCNAKFSREGEEKRTNLYSAYLTNSDLNSAVLTGVNLNMARLMGADLDNADLRSATLVYALLKGATLHSAKLNEASLVNANFINATLSYADLTDANLEGADLKGADLKGAIFKRTILKKTKINESAKKTADFSECDISEVIWDEG